MSVEMFGCQPGPVNGLRDVPGIAVGHADVGDSGVSVILAKDGAVASVDVRGGGPGTRETDLLEPHNTVEAIHAVALCGGSAFGLAAADGVMGALEAAGIGFPVLGPDEPDKIVPIVPAAVIFDLLHGEWTSRPTSATGRSAAEAALAASSRPFSDATPSNGNIGAGMGATAGALKGGFGQASAVFPKGDDTGLPDVLAGKTVAVGIVTNPQGAVFDPTTGRLWGFPAELAGEFGEASRREVDPSAFAELADMNISGTKFPKPQLNTTIGVVATDVPLTKAQAKRVALAAHDGLARAIRPAHMPMDGDTLFAMSTAGGAVDPVAMTVLSATAANCVERAIVHAVLGAETTDSAPNWRSIVE